MNASMPCRWLFAPLALLVMGSTPAARADLIFSLLPDSRIVPLTGLSGLGTTTLGLALPGGDTALTIAADAPLTLSAAGDRIVPVGAAPADILFTFDPSVAAFGLDVTFDGTPGASGAFTVVANAAEPAGGTTTATGGIAAGPIMRFAPGTTLGERLTSVELSGGSISSLGPIRVAAAPEPATWGAFAVGGLAVVLTARRRSAGRRPRRCRFAAGRGPRPSR